MSDRSRPALRFEGYDDEWRPRSFDEVAQRLTATTLSGPTPYVEYEDIASGDGVLNKDVTRKEGSKRGAEFKQGDVLFGKLRPYLKNWILADFDGVAVGDFWVLRAMDDPAFLYGLIQTTRFTQASSVSSGSKMPRSDWGLVARSQLPVPSTEEQAAIGGALHSVDALISLHQRRHTALQQAKTALLQGMFPSAGAGTPTLRLAGRNESWMPTTLGGIAHMYQPKTISSTDFVEHGIPVFGANGYIGYYSAANHDEDQVTVSARGAVGLPSYVRGPVWITGNSMVLAVDERRIAKPFLYAALQARVSDVRRYASGGVQQQLTREVLQTVPFAHPSLEEQQAIGAFFTRLDELIHAEQQYVSKFRQVKTALLQEMFV